MSLINQFSRQVTKMNGTKESKLSYGCVILLDYSIYIFLVVNAFSNISKVYSWSKSVIY